MAFLRRGIGDIDSEIGPAAGRTGNSKVLRWAIIPCLGAALACWSVTTLAGLHSAASLAYGRAEPTLFLQPKLALAPDAAGVNGGSALRALAGAAPAAHFVRAPVAPSPRASDPFADVVARAKLSREKLVAAFVGTAPAQTPAAPADPFAAIVASADLSQAKLHAALAGAGMEFAEPQAKAAQLVAAASAPLAARFHRLDDAAPQAGELPGVALSQLAAAPTAAGVKLAYAAVEEDSRDPVALALASLGDPLDGVFDEEAPAEVGGLPGDMPESVAVPAPRPEREPAQTARKPLAADPASADEEKPARTRKPSREDKAEQQRELAYARPDNPAGGVFKNLFKSPQAGDRVAVYDISAAVVHMPDGSKLEAHSGIGKMADNPRYVHVKMNGPTPPNTYRLSMREKRFHGVEAVRMTPVGGQTMHGRDGILAHSYLLRGGRAESHGCVAFKDYQRFLKAFKQGKVTHIMVVPSMSKAPKAPKVQMVSNSGRGA